MKIGRQLAWLFLLALLVVILVLLILNFNRTAEEEPAAKDPEPETEQTQKPPDDLPAEEQPQTDPTPEVLPVRQEPEKELQYQSYGNGTCCVTGIGTFSDSCLIVPKASPAGDRVVKIVSRAFFGCDNLTVVQIPETVQEIGEGAFADCRNLVYLSVSPQNPVYCDVDGVLFTADRHCLLQYPPLRVGDPLVIPASVVSISEMAFYQCKNLKSVHYEGSGEDWDRIQIGSRNYGLIATSIVFLRQE